MKQTDERDMARESAGGYGGCVESDPILMCPDCRDNGMQTPMRWRANELLWTCELHGIRTEQWAAANSEGPWAPPGKPPSPPPIPGFFWNGACYERSTERSDEDFKVVWRDGLAAVRSLRAKGQW